jgi:hypothetical protein
MRFVNFLTFGVNIASPLALKLAKSFGDRLPSNPDGSSDFNEVRERAGHLFFCLLLSGWPSEPLI